MATANSTSSTKNGFLGTLSASIPMDRFNRADLKLDGAQALVTMFGIYASEHEEQPVTGRLMNSAMSGINLLIESAREDIQMTGGAA